MSKTFAGNFFEDFTVGQQINHATPRTITEGDIALNTALYGHRFAMQSSDEFARSNGLSKAPVDNLLVFHIVLGKSVPDISVNAMANLGYAEGIFSGSVFPGDTLQASSEILGLKENSSGKTGIVYLRTTGTNQHGETVLEYIRWVMVKKKNLDHPTPKTVVPTFSKQIDIAKLQVPAQLNFSDYNDVLAGSTSRWTDYQIGEKIDHVDGITIESAEHMMATRLYQNIAKVHFNHHVEKQGRFGERLIYGGHVISLARALSFNGLQNACFIAGINGGSHANPCFAGDTVYAWSEVLDKAEIAGRSDVGALRLRLVATKDQPANDYPLRQEDGKYDACALLDFDYWVLIPR